MSEAGFSFEHSALYRCGMCMEFLPSTDYIHPGCDPSVKQMPPDWHQFQMESTTFMINGGAATIVIKVGGENREQRIFIKSYIPYDHICICTLKQLNPS